MAQGWVRHNSVVEGLWGHRRIREELEGHRMSLLVGLEGLRMSLQVRLEVHHKRLGVEGHYTSPELELHTHPVVVRQRCFQQLINRLHILHQYLIWPRL